MVQSRKGKQNRSQIRAVGQIQPGISFFQLREVREAAAVALKTLNIQPVHRFAGLADLKAKLESEQQG